MKLITERSHILSSKYLANVSENGQSLIDRMLDGVSFNQSNMVLKTIPDVTTAE